MTEFERRQILVHGFGRSEPPHTEGITTSRSRVGVSIILATLNEAAALPRLLETLRHLDLPSVEIIVIDDGSTDGTREFAERMARADPGIHLIRNAGPQTLRIAQLQGIAAARGRHVVVMDADLQHPPELVPRLVERLSDGFHLAVASRYGKGGSAGPRTPYRAAISRGAEILAKVMLPGTRSVTDPLSGFFAFDAQAFGDLETGIRGYKLLLSFLLRCDPRRVCELGYRFGIRESGSTKIAGNFRFLYAFVIELIQLRASARSPRFRGNSSVKGSRPRSV